MTTLATCRNPESFSRISSDSSVPLRPYQQPPSERLCVNGRHKQGGPAFDFLFVACPSPCCDVCMERCPGTDTQDAHDPLTHNVTRSDLSILGNSSISGRSFSACHGYAERARRQRVPCPNQGSGVIRRVRHIPRPWTRDTP